MRKNWLKEIIGRASGGAPVLTVNARLARSLNGEYDAEMSGRGLGAWPTPLILPLSSWARSLWEESAPGEPLLDATRGRELWERIAGGELVSKGGALAAGAAETAWAAYSVMKEYLIPWPEDDIYLTPEAKALKRWAKAYEREVRRLGFTDSTGLVERAAFVVGAGGAPLPKEVLIAGFDEITPAVALFLKALEKGGVNVRVFASPAGQANSKVAIRAYGDPAEEVEQAARWARAALAPGKSIAFVVPGLGRYRELIRREFSAELDPASALMGNDAPEAFNISLGLPLDEEPLAGSALAILAVGEGRVELDALFEALRSPYLSGADASPAASPAASMEAARVDALLRKDGRRDASLSDVARRLDGKAAPALKARCEAWLAWLRGARGRALPGAWAEDFSALLKRLGWPRGVKLSSSEFQALRSWNDVLRGLSILDEITGPVARAEAAALLRRLSANTIHQPETPECRIQVLGLLETAGLAFDHIWLMGCHENAFPAPASPNPFIPLHVQKRYDVPHSSPERELSFSRKVLERLLNSADSVVVSYPARVEGSPQLLSPLFRGMEEGGLIEASNRLKDLSRAGLALEEAPPDAPVPVGADERAFISGGTEIIKNQSHCPFKAFAVHRLGARALDEPEPGLSAVKRGSLLHAALKYFWEEAGDSERLKEMKEGGRLPAFAAGIADRALKEVDLPRPFSARFLDIERERLISVLTEWSEKELARGEFKVRKVEALEEMDIGGLRIRGRIDRVDELPGGGAAIIDYKSGGKASANDWLSRRPRDPQLLVYSTTGRYDAVSFARLVPGDCRFVGLSKDDKTLSGIKAYDNGKLKDGFEGADDWDKLMGLWKDIVHSLAGDFLSGLAAVDPALPPEDRNGPCAYCGLHPLCRVVETGEEGGQGGDEQDG